MEGACTIAARAHYKRGVDNHDPATWIDVGPYRVAVDQSTVVTKLRFTSQKRFYVVNEFEIFSSYHLFG